MQAIGYRAPGSDVPLTLMDVEVPEIGAGEALVRLEAIGVGSHDRWFLPAEPRYPYPIGIEGAGTVVAIGTDEAAGPGAVGDRVMFTSAMAPKGGTWAEFAAVSVAALIPLPPELAFTTAAALPVAGAAAIEGLNGLAIGAGETLFIAGASGAIGGLAVQLAAARGARVAGSASAANLAHVRELGAELVVDYRDPTWPDQVRAWSGGGVDAALTIPRGTGPGALAVVRAGGRLVTVSADDVTAERAITVAPLAHHSSIRDDLAELARAVADGAVRVPIEAIRPFPEGLDALAKTETQHARGKTVLVFSDR